MSCAEVSLTKVASTSSGSDDNLMERGHSMGQLQSRLTGSVCCCTFVRISKMSTVQSSPLGDFNQSSITSCDKELSVSS